MPFKVLHLIGQLERGGAERQLLHLSRALHERGWQQAIVTFSPGESWDGQAGSIGVPLFGIPRSPNKLLRLWQLCRIVRQERPVLIHSWSDHTNVYAHWVLYSKIHRIVAFRNNPTADQYTGKARLRVPNEYVYASADCVVSNSRAAIDRACAAGVKMRRSEVVTNIVFARDRANPGESVPSPRIAAAGSLIPRKAYDTLLHALGRLAADGLSFELLLAGEGPERHRLEELAVQLNISSMVRILGSTENVPALFASAHLLVHPSRSEGLSNTILEAMAEGLPVVASDVDGTSELISDGKTGLLVPPDRPEILASRIRRLLCDPALRSRLGKAGLEMVRDKCSVDSVTAHYESVYHSVAGK
jgi:glycosyltransferase involved in cell wall biosynthesis